MLRRTFPTKAVHRQRDLVRDMVNGDAVYPYERAAGTEEQFAAVLQLGVDALVPLDKHALESSLADGIAGFVHDHPGHFASVISAATMVRSLSNFVPAPAFQPMKITASGFRHAPHRAPPMSQPDAQGASFSDFAVCLPALSPRANID
jgi:hypothetical protein